MNQKWKSIAIEAAQKAGEKIIEIYNTDFKVYTKSDNSPVTTADLASNEIINFHLKKTIFLFLVKKKILEVMKIEGI